MKLPRFAAVGLVLVLGLVLAAIIALMGMGFPTTMAGMAAKTVCSGIFVAGRSADDVVRNDFLPASFILKAVELQVDAATRSVRAQVPGFSVRRAVHSPQNGCVLDGTMATQSPQPMTVSNPEQPWPIGDAPVPPATAARFEPVIAQAFAGGQGPGLQNTRALLVVHKGQLVAERYGPGFTSSTPLHGWSMTKTVAAMVVLKQAAAQGIDLNTPVLDLYRADAAPAWAAAWRTDGRAALRVVDLLFMRDGLANTEGYQPWSDVPRLLWGGPDVAGYAARARQQEAPGSRWRYLSATTNLLAHAMLARSGQTPADWVGTVTRPIGAHSFVVETDARGTPVMSSYGWATARDWAKLGLLLLRDGAWPDGPDMAAPITQVLPKGTLAAMTQPAQPSGMGNAYGMQVWLLGRAEGLCPAGALPNDTVAMSGHWGQTVAIVPSLDLIVVRLGWTMNSRLYDRCALVADIVKAL